MAAAAHRNIWDVTCSATAATTFPPKRETTDARWPENRRSVGARLQNNSGVHTLLAPNTRPALRQEKNKSISISCSINTFWIDKRFQSINCFILFFAFYIFCCTVFIFIFVLFYFIFYSTFFNIFYLFHFIVLNFLFYFLNFVYFVLFHFIHNF